MMKKFSLLFFLSVVCCTAGCAIKAPATGEITGDVQQQTGIIDTGLLATGISNINIPTEWFTGQIDLWIVPVVTWSETVVPEQTEIKKSVDTLIKKRETQPKDDTKLTEEDIDLMEQIIQKISDMNK